MVKKKYGIIKIFFTMLYLSAFTFGGGYVIISFMRRTFVDKWEAFAEEEMLNMLALAQAAPGPAAVNSATVVGYNLAGIPGVLAAVIGTLIPPLITFSVISYFYEAIMQNHWLALAMQGMKLAVAAVVIQTAEALFCPLWQKSSKSSRYRLSIITIVVVLAVTVFKLNPIWVIIGILLFSIFSYKFLIGRKKIQG